MSTACPQCGGILSSADALCPECLKRVALREAVEFDETEAAGVNDLLPGAAQRKSGRGANALTATHSPKGERWGDYELLERVGRGAMGTVFKARHVRLNRLVALKLIHQGTNASESERSRFMREAEAVARLQHPHIVTLFETGEAEGQPFLAMEYVPGKTLAETLAEKPLPPRPAAECVKKISEAVHYAHGHGVLHRDLKPSNVMLDLNAEPRVMDFGLARLTEQDSEMTLTGIAIGSPSYMAPEQAAGKVHEVSAVSDVYSLGAILYEALTARPPFQTESSVETMRQVVEKEPVSPRLLNASVPRDLETICLKCLEKDAARRYRNAQDLADDLGRFLRHEPVTARPIAAVAKLGRWCRRKPALAASLGAAVTLLLFVVIGSPIAILRINTARKLALVAERRTEQQLYAALLEQARATTLTGELGQRVHALDAVRRAGAISNSAALRGIAIATLTLPDLRLEREWPLPPETTLANLDPALERVALCRGSGPVEIRSVTNQRLLATLPASTNLPAYVGLWNPDGRFFAVSRDHNSVESNKDAEVWEVAGAKRVLVRALTSGAMSFHPRLPRIIIGEPPAAAVVWNLETGEELKRHSLKARPEALKFSPDGERFAAILRSGQGWTVTVHNAADATVCASHEFADRAREPAWHPGGHWIAVPTMNGTVYGMDAQTGQTRVLGAHKIAAVRAVFNPEGNYLFTSGWDRQVICWDANAMRRAFTVGLASFQVQFRKDGSQCVLMTEVDPRLQFYTFEPRALCREFAEDLGGSRNYAAFSRDGRWLAECGAERLVVWDLSGNGPGAVVEEAANTRLAFTSNGELFADRPGTCFRWRVGAGTNASAPVLEPLPISVPAGFESLALMSNGVVLTSTRGSTLVNFDRLAAAPEGWHPTADGLNSVSLDGRWLGMFRSYGQDFHVYRLPGFERVAGFTSGALIGQFAFSPQGEEVAVCQRTGVEFWNTTRWERTRYLTNFNSVLYSHNGQTVWLATYFRDAGLYDSRTAELLLPLPSGTLPLALSTDGRYLAVSVDVHRAQVWDLVELRSRLGELKLDWSDEPVKVPSARR